MSKTIQKPRECRNAHCGAMCCPIQVEEMQIMWGGNPNKCPYYERRDDLYRKTEILDKIKQAREKMWEKVQEYSGSGNEVTQAYCDGFKDSLAILDKLIEESEEK